MIAVNRQDFLQRLELVTPGLTMKENVEQASSFVIQNGKILTYNEEVCCCIPVPKPMKGKITGAVSAKPLLEVLRGISDEDITISTTEQHLKIKGRERTKIRMDAEITMPLDDLETPNADDFKDLHPEFLDALKLVQNAAGKDESEPSLTCVMIHPKHLLASDNNQIGYYRIKTGFSEKTLLRRDAIRQLSSCGVSKFAETENWIHFKGPQGLIYSVRRQAMEFPVDFLPLLEMDGDSQKIVFPKIIANTAKLASIFSSEDADHNQILVRIKDGRIHIMSEGSLGEFAGKRKIKHKGDAIEFHIHPTVFQEIINNHHECQIQADRLRVTNGPFKYVVSLFQDDDEDASVEDEGAEE